MKRSYAFVLFPVAGMVFCLWYVCAATCDVVNSDYIRLVNSYLPDVWDPEKFFVADVLTRIPVNYLARGINTALFGFSVRFDQILGILGLGFGAYAAGMYVKKEGLGIGTLAAVTLLMFSLNKWEMLTNGSGWAHFLTFACFYYYYLVLDRVWQGAVAGPGYEKKGDKARLMALPFIITLGIAGQYCAVYSGVLLLTYGVLAVWGAVLAGKKQRYALPPAGRLARAGKIAWWKYFLCVLIPLLLYMASNACTVEEHAGATTLTLTEALAQNPKFFPAFFIKSFASMFLGGETMQLRLHLSNRMMIYIGLAVMAGYLLGLWLNVRYRLYERTIFPLLLILSGGCSHVLILISRWIFLDQENYGMSSRYAVQFQMGIIGIVLTAALVWQTERIRRAGKKERSGRAETGRRGRAGRHTAGAVLAAVFSAAVLLGNAATTADELAKAPHRKSNYETKVQVALNYQNEDDQTLADTFEYRKGPEKIRAALGILEEHHWNVYRD